MLITNIEEDQFSAGVYGAGPQLSPMSALTVPYWQVSAVITQKLPPDNWRKK
jgi:hypothetical protein